MDEGQDAGWSSGDEALPTRPSRKPAYTRPAPSHPIRAERGKFQGPKSSTSWRNSVNKTTAAAPSFVKGVVMHDPPKPKTNLMRDYSSSSSSGWSEDDDHHKQAKSAPLKPSQLLAPLKPQPPPPKSSHFTREPFQQQDRPQQLPPQKSVLGEPDRNRAQPISANVMESKYGVGFDLMSKMGLSATHIDSSATPIIPEQRARDEGISSVPKIPQQQAETTRSKQNGEIRKMSRKRSRRRKADSSEEEDSSSDASSSAEIEELQPRTYGEAREMGKSPARRKSMRRSPVSHPYSRDEDRKTVQQTLREIRELSEKGDVVDFRGSTPHVHPAESLATVVAQKPSVATGENLPEETRRQRILCFGDRLKEVERELRRRCEHAKKVALDILKSANLALPREKEAIGNDLDLDDADEDRIQLGGATKAEAPTEIVDLTKLRLSAEGLQLDWLLAQVYDLEKNYPAEMYQVKFRTHLHQLAEVALEADLQSLANIEYTDGDIATLLENNDSKKSDLLDKWTSLHPALVELRNYIVGRDESDSQSVQVYDQLMKRTVLVRFLKPFFEHCWDPVSDADIGVELMELSISKLISKSEFEDYLQSLILPRLSVTMELESSRFDAYPPHLWLGQWLPNLSKLMEEAILAKLVKTALANFVQAPIIVGRNKKPKSQQIASSNADGNSASDRQNVDKSLLTGQWLHTWKSILTREQWDTIIFQGVFGLLKRWLTSPELSPALSTYVPDTLNAFLNSWRQDLPASLISSTVVETYGKRVLDWLRGLQRDEQEAPGPQLDAVAALDGYGSWKILRKELLPELKSFLKEVLDLLEKVIQK